MNAQVDRKPSTRKQKSLTLPLNVHRIADTDLLYTTSGDEVFTHQDAATWAKKLPKVDGYTKWDLAEKREAVLLIDDERYDPAVNTKRHRGIVSSWYWLKRTLASSSDLAWDVNFDTGDIFRSYRYDLGRAVAVCRPVPASQ